jgi:hypothetical protein
MIHGGPGMGRYLAHGAQAMFIRGAAGEPPVVDASNR